MRKPGRKPGFCMHLFRSLRGIAAPGRLVFRTRAAAICRV